MKRNNKVNGNVFGLKESVLKELETLYGFKTERGSFFSRELSEKISLLTAQIKREVAVYITRSGEVIDVIVGTGEEVSLPKVNLMRSDRALCGVRCFHTHPEGTAMLSRLDETVLKSYRLDAMTARCGRGRKACRLFCCFPGGWRNQTDL